MSQPTDATPIQQMEKPIVTRKEHLVQWAQRRLELIGQVRKIEADTGRVIPIHGDVYHMLQNLKAQCFLLWLHICHNRGIVKDLVTVKDYWDGFLGVKSFNLPLDKLGEFNQLGYIMDPMDRNYAERFYWRKLGFESKKNGSIMEVVYDETLYKHNNSKRQARDDADGGSGNKRAKGDGLKFDRLCEVAEEVLKPAEPKASPIQNAGSALQASPVAKALQVPPVAKSSPVANPVAKSPPVANAWPVAKSPRSAWPVNATTAKSILVGNTSPATIAKSILVANPPPAADASVKTTLVANPQASNVGIKTTVVANPQASSVKTTLVANPPASTASIKATLVANPPPVSTASIKTKVVANPPPASNASIKTTLVANPPPAVASKTTRVVDAKCVGVQTAGPEAMTSKGVQTAGPEAMTSKGVQTAGPAAMTSKRVQANVAEDSLDFATCDDLEVQIERLRAEATRIRAETEKIRSRKQRILDARDVADTAEAERAAVEAELKELVQRLATKAHKVDDWADIPDDELEERFRILDQHVASFRGKTEQLRGRLARLKELEEAYKEKEAVKAQFSEVQTECREVERRIKDLQRE